ncbi:MAG: DNA adenine methylase [Nitrospira sp.]|nr:DNA adenine methylase [Nitrospira sp.]
MSRPQAPDLPPPSRLIHYTPLRYPGGKAKLASFAKQVIENNRLNDGTYVEPYAGGAAIALELLFHEYVSEIYINDISRPIYAFWKSTLDHTDELLRSIHDTPLTVRTWDKQKQVLTHQAEHDDLSLGFAMFFLNRTNRSGILNGGIIGGRDQTGPWKIDARYNKRELSFRIESIAKLRKRIHLSKMDALVFLSSNRGKWPNSTLIYLDPPYYRKGKDLYLDYYSHSDHEQVASTITKKIRRQKWMVSYDDTKPVRELYSSYRSLAYKIGYSARETRAGREIMFFCDDLEIPPLSGAMQSGISGARRTM